MMIELFYRSTLTLINKKLKYPLAVAEKDYFLAIVSKIIYESALKDVLIFKGGTALYHVYLPQLRFSEDIEEQLTRLEFAEISKPTLPRGFATLVSVLLVGVVGLAISVSLLLLGLSSSRTSFALAQSFQAKALTDACAEEALEQIRDSTQFTGSGALTLGLGSCSYTVTSQGGANRTITAVGTVFSMTRRVRIIINQINPTINVTSWQEVADF